MPVSEYIVTVSPSLDTKKTPTDFLGNCVQFTNTNQGFITAIVGMLTIVVLMSQLWIMCRQSEISSIQAEISREAMFFPFQQKALLEWIEATEEAELLLQEYIEGSFRSKKELTDLFKEVLAKLRYKSSFASALFAKNISEKIDELSPIRTKENLLLRLEKSMEEAVKMHDTPTKEKKFTQGYDPRFIKLEIGRVREEVAKLIRENYKNSLQ